MAAKSGSKNNVANRGKGAAKRFFKGKEVKPVKVFDKKRGLSFIGAQFDNGEPVMDAQGNFVQYQATSTSMDEGSK
jgi:hypothetical protein